MSGYEQRADAFFEAQQIEFDQPHGDAEARRCLAAEFEQVAAEARGREVEEAVQAVLAAQVSKRSSGATNVSVLPVSFILDRIRALAPRPGLRLVAREDLAKVIEAAETFVNNSSLVCVEIRKAINRLRAGEE